MGVGPAQGAALVPGLEHSWGTSRDKNVDFTHHDEIDKSPICASDPDQRRPLRRTHPHESPGHGYSKAVGTGPEGLVDPRGLWCGLKGEIALSPPPVQRGVLGDPAIPFKLLQWPSRAAHFSPGCTLKKPLSSDGRWRALEEFPGLLSFSSGTEE